MTAPVKAWWRAREPRERQILGIGGVLLVLMLGWAFVWFPLDRAVQSLATRLQTQQRDLAYMQRAKAELLHLRAEGGKGRVQRGGQSLLALTDASARKAKLGPALKRIEPLDEKRVRMEFSGAGFDALAAWLDDLQHHYGIVTLDASISRAGSDGVVDARLTVQEP